MKQISKFRTLPFYLLLIILALASSCKKELPFSSITVPAISKNPIPPYVFNWETATYMPTSPANIVAMPWIGQVGGVDGNIASDFKSSDGWSLVYNTFNPTASPYLNTAPPGGLYFALYNKYRGLLRFYLYIPTGVAVPSSTIAHGLSLYPSGSTSSSMLNFEKSDLVDAGSNTSGITKTNNQQINLMGNWCVCQYEIAYDPAIVTTSTQSLKLQWNSQSINVTQLSLEGTQVGTLSGTIGTPTSGFDPATLVNGLVSANMQIFGSSALNSLGTPLAGTPYASFITNVSSALTSAAAGTIKGIVNMIIGGNSSNLQEVNLNMKTKISLTGSLTNSIGITNPNFAIPGETDQLTANALIPNYTSPMGVLNVSAKPTVNVHKVQNWTENPRTLVRSGKITKTYSLNTNSIQLIFNPAVTNSASIIVLNKEIMLINPIEPNISFTPYQYMTITGTQELIGNINALSNPTTVVYQYGPPGANQLPYFGATAIRVTIKVTPNNGAPSSTIVKTFLANEVPI